MKTSTTGDPWRDKTDVIAEMEDDWRHWASAVCDPATPAQTLTVIVQTLAPHNGPPPHDGSGENVGKGGRRVLEAVAAHPNAPPSLLTELLAALPDTARGVCRNPAAPFLLLEAPNFIGALSHGAQLALLRQSDLPPIFARQMTTASQIFAKSENFRKYLDARFGSVEEAARFHVAFAGELPYGGDAWQKSVCDYWKIVCANPNMAGGDEAAELVEIGLAPSWAHTAAGENGANPASAPKAQKTPLAADYPFLEGWFRYECKEGSPEEIAMLRQIGPDVRDRSVFARALRASGTANDLVHVAKTERSGRGLIAQALIRHPNVDASVLQALAARENGVSYRDLLRHEKAGKTLLVKLMEHADINVRRMARQHKNAPQDKAATARRAFARRAYGKTEPHVSPFASFVASLTYPTRATPIRLLNRAESLRWTERMEAVFIASASSDLLRADDAGRTCADLLHHLSQDGNRLVRAAARACFANPDQVFTWGEEQV